MTATFLSEEPERRDWLAWRRHGIGGSDIAAIAGFSPFASPMAVYLDKLELAPEVEETERMRWGRLLEGPIADEFGVRTGLAIVEPQVRVFDDAHPHRRATLDGLVVDSRAGWENGPGEDRTFRDLVLGTAQIKTTSDRSWNDGIPERVLYQTLWELGIATLPRAWLPVLHGGQRLAIYEVDASELVFRRLCAIADRFWTEHVLAEVPPPADSNPATTEALKAAYRETADGSTRELTGDALEAALEWPAAKSALAAAEAWVARVENVIRAELGEASFGARRTDDGELETLLSWKPQGTGRRIDADALRAAEPELAEKFTKPAGTTRVLRPTKALRALAGDPEGATE